MRFLVDAQLPPRLAEWLRDRGHEASHVRDAGLASRPDEAIIAQAAKTRSVIVTKDADFSRLPADLSGCQVVWLRFGNGTSRDLIACLGPIFAEVEKALAEGQRLVEVSR